MVIYTCTIRRVWNYKNVLKKMLEVDERILSVKTWSGELLKSTYRLIKQLENSLRYLLLEKV